MLELFDRYYGNSCKGDFPQGREPEYKKRLDAARDAGVHWLTGVGDFEVGKRKVSEDEVKSWLD